MDMNLIRTFVTVYQHQSYTRAAEVIGVSQSAISQAIHKMEAETGSKLFVKSGRGITATRRASQLARECQRALEMIDNAFSQTEKYSIYCVEAVIHSMSQLHNIVLKVPPLDQDSLFSDLRTQKVDLVIDSTTSMDSAFVIEPLLAEPIKVICRNNHPRVHNGKLTKEQFYQEEHVVYKARREGRQFLEVFARETLLPRIDKIEISSQPGMVMLVSETDYFGLLTESFCHRWADRLGLQVLDLPIAHDPVTINMIYHQRSKRDPSHIKLRERVKRQLIDSAVTS